MIAKIIMFILTGLRPLLGPAECRFPVSCTNYALEQLQTESLFIAIKNITKRVLSCNPLF